MSKFKMVLKTVTRFVDDNLPTILSGLAIAGLGTSVAAAIKETPKAQEALEEEVNTIAFTSNKEELEKRGCKLIEDPEEIKKVIKMTSNERGFSSMLSCGKDENAPDKVILYNGDRPKMTFWEKFKVLAPIYWPCALATVGTGMCIIGSNVAAHKKFVGLAAVLAAQTKDIGEYKDKVKEIIGDKKVDEVKKELAKDKMMSCPEEIANDYVVGTRYPMNFLGCWWVGTKAEVETAFNRWNRSAVDTMRRTYSGNSTMDLEDLLCELESSVADPRCDFKEKGLLRHIKWLTDEGSIGPEFVLAENTNGIPGYSINISRSPIDWDEWK